MARAASEASMRAGSAWLFVLLLMLSLACVSTEPPLRVERAPGDASRRSATQSVVSNGQLSAPTKIALRRRELDQLHARDAAAAIAALHDLVALRVGGSDEYFALAELSFQQAERLEAAALRQARIRDRKRHRGLKPRPPPFFPADWALVSEARTHYLAAAIYAYTFIFTEDPVGAVSRHDPRMRTSVDVFNRALALAFQDASGYVRLASGEFRVPFGTVDVSFDEADRVWGNRLMVDFIPSDELVVHGLRNRYRRPGVGAPLAARTVPIDRDDPAADLVDRNAVVSATAVLLLDDPRGQLEGDRVAAKLQVGPWSEYETVDVAGDEVPLEAQPSVALAASLQESTVWRSRFGVFLGRITNLSDENALFGWEPRIAGRIPVIFVHGTMSSPAVWGDMVNDLQSDPIVRDRYQFLFFSYQSGNPILHSGMLLRRSLVRAVDAFDPSGRDGCLRAMVIAGHSQGGLLAKLAVIESGTALWDSRFDRPLAETGYRKQSKALLQEAFFIEPLPFVDRVVFISTPHRGSFMAASWIAQALAARAIRLPGDLSSLAADVTGADAEYGTVRSLRVRSSIHNMSPRDPLIQALARVPVAPTVRAHSIISVQGNGPVEEGSDGVVRFSSATIAEAESELIVSSGHSSQAHPRTIEEMRRILVEHAERTDCSVQPLAEH